MVLYGASRVGGAPSVRRAQLALSPSSPKRNRETTGPAGSVSASLAGLRADPNLRFPARPRLIDDLRVFQMPDGLGLQLHFGDAPVVLRGQLSECCFPFLREYLNGTHDIDQLAAAMPSELPVSSVARTLWLLHSKGLLVDGESSNHPMLTWRAPDPIIGRQLLFWGRHIGDTRAAASGEDPAPARPCDGHRYRDRSARGCDRRSAIPFWLWTTRCCHGTTVPQVLRSPTRASLRA